MSGTFEGLRLAVRSRLMGKSSPLAIGEILGSLSAEERTELQAALAAPTPEASNAPEPEASDPPVGEAAPSSAADPKPDAGANDDAVAAAHAEGVATERARCLAVMESEHFAGREQAATLLLDSDIPADKICAKLAKMTKSSAADPMLGRLAQTPNPDLGAGAETNTDTKAAADSIWDRVRASNGR
jgi:hypothetical protein